MENKEDKDITFIQRTDDMKKDPDGPYVTIMVTGFEYRRIVKMIIRNDLAELITGNGIITVSNIDENSDALYFRQVLSYQGYNLNKVSDDYSEVYIDVPKLAELLIKYNWIGSYSNYHLDKVRDDHEFYGIHKEDRHPPVNN